MKQCEICGQTRGQISGKTGKFGMDLCMKHYVQMGKYGNITDNTPAVKTLEYKERYPVIEATYEVIDVKLDNRKEYKVNFDYKKATAHNEYRDMLIEILESCSNNPAAIMLELLKRNIERGAIEELSTGMYRLTKKYAEPM